MIEMDKSYLKGPLMIIGVALAVFAGATLSISNMDQEQQEYFDVLREYCTDLGYDGLSSHYEKDGVDWLTLVGHIEFQGELYVSCYTQSIVNSSIVTDLELIELTLEKGDK